MVCVFDVRGGREHGLRGGTIRPVFREAEQGRIATAESAVIEASLRPNPVRGMLVDPGDHP